MNRLFVSNLLKINKSITSFNYKPIVRTSLFISSPLKNKTTIFNVCNNNNTTIVKNYCSSSDSNNDNVIKSKNKYSFDELLDGGRCGVEDPRIMDAFYKIMELEFHEDFDEAISIGERMVDRFPNSFDAHVTLARLLLDHKNDAASAYDLAKHAFDQGLEPFHHACWTDALELMGRSLQTMNRRHEAIVVYQELLDYCEREYETSGIGQLPLLVRRDIYKTMALDWEKNRDSLLSSQRVLKSIESSDARQWEPMDAMFLGVCEFHLGNKEESLKYLNKGLDNYIKDDYDSQTDQELAIYNTAQKLRDELQSK
ncbi:hypothetical protein PPL_01303 [Heterostelium album PN500]|uniref:Uncharacterized protein n=1 Tax=Heterostelium pallidum (strain ATCC 26659 / Pp 5 / PN500) TaxID=670386 RepID=D3AYN9_HETP5|nr:hypothetical protein PPL_01303 [Heterostelium album PN500]EFA86066.1 hypothetical protein PPL_01303 [Heterostelium album PN500]|eukprot:XP_020438172.1 hypothetical protein PPL_01303 [Heterostelium album PN500]